MDSLIIIDDVISKGYQDFIEKMDFPWYFSDQVTDSREGSSDISTGFSFDILRKNCQNIEEEYNRSSFSDGLIPLLCEAVGKVDNDRVILEIFRIRAGMFIKNQNNIPHQAHVDRHDLHYTMLYYVNDSDGPTNIFDYKGENVIQEIEPKKGRVVIMTGDTYHSSSSPRNHNNRIVVNYNFLV